MEINARLWGTRRAGRTVRRSVLADILGIEGGKLDIIVIMVKT